MAHESKIISIDEFSNNLMHFVDLVLREHETVVVEREVGEKIVLKPVRTRKSSRLGRRKTKADYEAFRAAAGSWQDEDTDTFLKAVYESRRNSSRPPVDL